MSSLSQRLAARDQIELIERSASEHVPEAPLTEVYGKQRQLDRNENISLSKRNNWDMAVAPRNALIDMMIERGELTESELQGFWITDDRKAIDAPSRAYAPAQRDYGAVADYAQRKGLNVDSDVQIQDDIYNRLREERREIESDLSERTDWKGTLTKFASTMVTLSTEDPINLVSMLIPVAGGAKHGQTVGAAMLRAGASAGAANAAAEAAVQSFVLPYKKEIGSPYEWTDGLMNVGLASLFGVALGSAGGGFGQWRLNRQLIDLPEAAGADAPIDVVPAIDGGDDAGVAMPAQESATTGTVRTPSGMEVGFEWQVVDLADIRTSDQAGYAGNLQPRDRSKLEMQGQVEDIAAKLDPQSLGASRGAETGAPIVGPSGDVESGNGRVMAIRRAAEAHPERYGEYKEFISRTTGRDVDDMTTPVLIRRRTDELTDDELTRFTVEANKGQQAAFDAAEVARADAALLDGAILAEYKGGDVSLARNAGFVAKVLDAMPAGERNALSADGRITPEGITRLRNMLMTRAYGGDEASDKLLRELAISSDDNARAISGALQDSAGRFARLRVDLAGTQDAVFDIGNQVIEALSVVKQLREQGKSAGDWLAQSDMLTPRDDVVDALVRVFFDESMTRGMSRQKVAATLNDYVDRAYARAGTADMFGDGAGPARLLDEARAQAQDIDIAEAADAVAARQYEPPDNLSDDLTPADRQEAAARADAVEDKYLDIRGENGLTMREQLAQARERAQATDAVIACMIGGAASG